MAIVRNPNSRIFQANNPQPPKTGDLSRLYAAQVYARVADMLDKDQHGGYRREGLMPAIFSTPTLTR